MAARGQFSNRLGFIMAAAGSAVGLGNIWKFPFEAGEGGGAMFLLIYLIFCFVLCLPVMVAEIAIGRKTNRNPVGAFNALGFPQWNWVGKLGVLAGVLILSFYNVVAGWAFGYFIEMVMGNFAIGEQFSEFTADYIKVGGYALVFMVTTAYVVSRGISAGIERATKTLMPTLIIIILGLAIYGFTLEHSAVGLKFYLYPDPSKLSFKVIYKALGQAFFSLSLGMGALITYGSYVSKRDNIITSAVYITLMDVGIAFLAGLLMFPLVAFNNGGDMSEVSSGPGLIFVTLPGVFEQLGGVAGIVIGAIFFLLLSFAALTSTVSLLEVPVSYMVDEHGAKRHRAVMIISAIIFLIGIPSMLSQGAVDALKDFVHYENASKSFMDLVEDLASNTFLPLGGFLVAVFVAYVWKTRNLQAEIADGFPGYEKTYISKYINFAIMVLCPLVLGSIFVLTVLSKFFGISIFPA